jgi:conjugative transfer region protein (TIGR03750 family)
MDTPQNETLAGRLNSEPVVFQGCTSSEIVILLIAAAAFWLPLSILVAAVVGYWVTVVMGGTILGVSVTMYFAPKRFQAIKRGRPDGYYQQRGVLMLARLGLRPSLFITRSGLWATGRSH